MRARLKSPVGNAREPSSHFCSFCLPKSAQQLQQQCGPRGQRETSRSPEGQTHPPGGQGLEGNGDLPASELPAPLRCQNPVRLPVPVSVRGKSRAGRSPQVGPRGCSHCSAPRRPPGTPV